MRLKSVKLQGFKTFVDKSILGLPSQITGIVGPNGCGKSNIVDAIRWVLGESSAKNIRGNEMMDVIFNGTSGRKPSSTAYVELVFDNDKNRLIGEYANYTEIAVKRQISRDGSNTYFLNGTKCRKRDITDLFLGTGLGPRSYAIVEQGSLSKLIEARPQEMRVHLEEAAGISRYKERRKEAETRIKHTRENLARLTDVRHEMAKNIEKLKRQATTASRYKELKQKERTLRAELSALKFTEQNNAAVKAAKSAADHEIDLEQHKAQSAELETRLETMRLNKDSISERANKLQQEHYALGTEIAKLELQIKNEREKGQKLNEEISKTQSLIDDVTAALEEQNELQSSAALQPAGIEPARDLLAAKLESAEEELSDAEHAYRQSMHEWESAVRTESAATQLVSSLKAKIENEELKLQHLTDSTAHAEADLSSHDGDDPEILITELETGLELAQAAEDEAATALQQQQDQAENLRMSLAEAEKKLSELQHSKVKMQSRADALSEIQARTGENKTLEQYFAEHDIQCCAVAGQMKVAPGFEKAVENTLALLGNPALLSAWVDSDDVTGSFILQNTESGKSGTLGAVVEEGAFPEIFNLISTSENDDGLRIDKSGLISCGNWTFSGTGSELNGHFERQQLIEEIAYKISVTDTAIDGKSEAVNAAREELEACISRINHASGTLQEYREIRLRTEGDLNHARKHADSAKKQRERLLNQKHDNEAKMSACREAITALNADIIIAEAQSEEAGSIISDSRETKTQAEQTLQSLKSSTDVIRNKHHEASIACERANANNTRITENIRRLESELQRHVQTMSAHTNAHNAAHNSEASADVRMEEQLQEMLSAHEISSSQLQEAQQQLAETDETIRKEEMSRSGFRAREDAINRTLSDLHMQAERHKISANAHLEQLSEIGISIEEACASLTESADISKWEEELQQTRNAVSRLGAVNVTAMEEVEQQSERKENLDKQNEDLEDSLKVLEDAIAKIDKETRTKFKETFDKVNTGLQDLFPKVFGGGSAYLELDDNNLLEAGVRIMARPPGKKNATIHLLSGGEKTMTALALIMSIFQLNPAPFCILDEVDAPLDDANAARFCDLVKSMADKVQFMYITHQKVSMSMAMQLAGVTMHERGVSRLVSVDVSAAEEMIQQAV